MGLGLFEIIILLIFPGLIIWAFVLFDVLRSTFTGNNKLIWFLAVAFIPIIGLIAYIFIGRGQKVRN